jgi:flagellar motility protein MotE (MotC chaperone)
MENNNNFELIQINANKELENAQDLQAMLKEYKAFEDRYKAFKERVLQTMQEQGIKSLDNDFIRITKIDETMSESFDSRAFKKDNRELYDSYVVMKPKAAYLKIEVK